MSLINSMLSDLDARRPDRRKGHDFALDGLEPVRSTSGDTGTAAALRLILLAALIGSTAACAAWYALRWLAPEPSESAAPLPHAVTPPPAAATPAGAAPRASAPEPADAPDASLLSLPVAPDGFAATPPAERLGYAAAIERMPAATGRFVPDEGHGLDSGRLVSEPASAAAAPAFDEPVPEVAELVLAPEERAEPPVEYPGTLRKAPRPSEPEPASRLRVLLERARFGAPGETLPELATLAREFPGYMPAQEAYAGELLRTQARGAAERVLRAALAREPGAARIAMMLAHLLVDRGRLDDAIAALRGAAPAENGDAEYVAFIAALEQRSGRHALAIEAYRQALALGPERGVWWMGLAISLAANGAGEDARQAFERALVDRALSDKLRRYANAELSRLSGNS